VRKRSDGRCKLSANPGFGDRAFLWGARGSGTVVLAAMLALGRSAEPHRG
jgi:hypothetical protein